MLAGRLTRRGQQVVRGNGRQRVGAVQQLLQHQVHFLLRQIAVGAGGAILRSTDEGQTWAPLNSGTTADLYGVSYGDPNNVYAVGANGTILHSPDFGQTWTRQNSGTTATLYQVSGFSSGTFVVGANGTILRAPPSGQTWARQNSGTTADLLDVFADLRSTDGQLAVDKNGLAKAIFGGFARVDDGQILSPSWTGYNKSLKPYPYNLDQAKSLIEAAGATGKTINFVGEAGRWLKDKETIESIASFWRAAGLKVNVQIFDFAEWLNRLFDKENRPDVIYFSSSNELLDADRNLSAYYAPSGIGASNDDADLEKWLTQARTELNPAKRQALYNLATKRALDRAYFVFLLNMRDLYGTSKRLNWTPRQDSLLFVKTMSIR